MMHYDIWTVVFRGANEHGERTAVVVWEYKPSGVNTESLVEFARAIAADQAPSTNPRTLTLHSLFKTGEAYGL